MKLKMWPCRYCPEKCGPYTQMVFISRSSNMESISLGTCRILVFISRWSLKWVWLYTGNDDTAINITKSLFERLKAKPADNICEALRALGLHKHYYMCRLPEENAHGECAGAGCQRWCFSEWVWTTIDVKRVHTGHGKVLEPYICHKQLSY